MDNLNELNIYIQKNKELYLTNDVSLVAITGKIVDYVNGLLNRESILIKNIAEIKENSDKVLVDLNNTLNDFIKTETENYNNFEVSIKASLNDYITKTNKVIADKSSEVDERIANLDISGAVADYFNEQLKTSYFNNLYFNTKAQVYVLSYYGDTKPSNEQYGPYYITSEEQLYTRLNRQEDLIPSCLYFYDGSLYVVIEENGKNVLRKGSVTSG